ncbi:uncharacterized protein DUF4199 [Mucilaginibacter frigoritolerans]|jgi:hypothetical protein|uniref:Uncharacterized protein DUF4199 n=1 Tax=Mucilaginibacter frigoritolerans TaxID=652788 RepID=A0A562TVL7_9SPHI|nr:DUF4199 domain-containing protein [Mucilaginibacter frigoritolerans]TWI97669.1 uncharacterized protein DUF4199 [Mucilaginibacter frigoritolerans]
MENSKPSSSDITIKWAVIYMITSVIFTFAFQFLNINIISPVRYISFIPYILFLFLAQKEYKDKTGGFLKFGDGFLVGLFFAIYSAVFGAIFSYIYFSFLSPEAWQQYLDAMQAKASVQPNVSSDALDAVMNFYRKYGKIVAAAGALITGVIIGAIIALIGAAIFKKEKSITDIENDANAFTDPTV